jgi:hypothetical protein
MLAKTKRSRRPGRIALVAALLLAALPLLAQYERKLQYQNRGDRWEGVKAEPVGGNDVELLSALVDAREPSSAWPPVLHLRFYLPTPGPVSITVRQPRPKTTYYWLDQVVPRTPWRPNAANEFTWRTETVLKELRGVTLADLGAVVRLGPAKGPSNRERVAPTALYFTGPPATVGGYRFTFKTNGGAQVTGKIYRGDREVFQRPRNRETAGSPFTVSWPAQGQPDGEYRLVLSGYYDTNDRLDQEVVFHHRASWQ